MAIEIHQLTVNSSMTGRAGECNDQIIADRRNAKDSPEQAEKNVDCSMISSLKKELAEECRRIIVSCLEEQRSR